MAIFKFFCHSNSRLPCFWIQTRHCCFTFALLPYPLTTSISISISSISTHFFDHRKVPPSKSHVNSSISLTESTQIRPRCCCESIIDQFVAYNHRCSSQTERWIRLPNHCTHWRLLLPPIPLETFRSVTDLRLPPTFLKAKRPLCHFRIIRNYFSLNLTRCISVPVSNSRNRFRIRSTNTEGCYCSRLFRFS